MASKDSERLYLDEFLKRVPDAGEVVAHCESPDFVVRDRQGLLGVEVVQVFRDVSTAGSRSRELESRRSRALRDLAQRYYRSGGEPLLVKASFDGPMLSNEMQITRALRARRPRTPWADARLHMREQNAHFYLTALPEEAGQYRRWICVSNGVGWVRRTASDVVGAAIHRKASKLAAYRSVVDRVALLVVADSTSMSGMLEYVPPDPPLVAEGFEAVYFYRHPHEAMRVA